MKKKVLLILGAVLAVLLIVLAVLGTSYRKITVVSGREYVDRCPRFARPGQEVTVTTVVVSDGEVCVNGAEGTFVSPGVWVFAMPDGNVELRVTVVAFRDGA